MSVEYNSQLIDRLYRASDEREAEKVLEEMEEISNPIFVWPIFAAYKRFKNKSNSHYFICALNRITSGERKKIMLEIISESDISHLDYTYALEGLQKYEYFESNVIKHAGYILREFAKKNTIINLDALLEYLKAACIIQDFTDSLKIIFEDEKFDQIDRSLAINYLLNIDPKSWLQFYIENHYLIADNSAEILLSKVLNTWNGTLVKKLKEKIKQEGGARAREIIESAEKKKVKEEKSKEQKELTVYSNAEIISKITNLREKINTFCIGEKNIGFKLFSPVESIYKQLKAPTDEATLKDYFIDLREVFGSISKQVNTHNIDFEKAQEIIPNLRKDSLSKSINQLHLFLYSRDIKVKSDLYGLRPINRVVNLWLHPSNLKELFKLLEKENMLGMYKKDDWMLIHIEVLKRYYSFLEELHKKLIIFSNSQGKK